jgi:bifunctional DNase/RNase
MPEPGNTMMVQMRVTGLTQKPDAREATLLLQDVTGCLGLAFVIPMNEANRLARVLGRAGCTCAPVYELLLELAVHGGLAVTRTVLDGDDRGICAALVLERDGASIEVSCHPADAIALAVRTQTPIYAAAGAVDHACRLGPPPEPPPAATSPGADHADVARWLESLRPEDFDPAGP